MKRSIPLVNTNASSSFKYERFIVSELPIDNTVNDISNCLLCKGCCCGMKSCLIKSISWKFDLTSLFDTIPISSM